MTLHAVACATVADFRVVLRPSRLWRSLLALSALTLLLAWPAQVSPGYLLLLPWPLWRLWRLGGEVTALQVREGCRLSIWQGAQQTTVEVGPGSVALPGLIILHYRLAGRRRYCLLLADSASADARRRLRIFIRWHHPAPALQVSPS